MDLKEKSSLISSDIKNERIDLNPTKWGPKAWYFLDSIGLSFPDNPSPEELNSAIQFIKSLKHLIPCNKCRCHYNEFIVKFPPEQIKDGIMFRKYLLALHNNIRRINGQKTIGESEMVRYYINQYKCIDSSYLCIMVIIIILIVILSACLVGKYIKKINNILPTIKN